MTFIGVALGQTTRQADRRLIEYLSEKSGIGFAQEDLEYEEVIQRLVRWRQADGLFLARMTPYAYVVSELLGASVEPLATYVSTTTGRTTYHSFFVVNRKDFPSQPTLPDVLRFLTNRKDRAKFVFQSEFSTSSYFLPSLYFKSHKIFQMPESTESLFAIASEKFPDASSSTLVELVARGSADVAAVWDGIRADYEVAGRKHEGIGEKVYFVQLPTTLPNDLLVCSPDLDPPTKNLLRQQIADMRPNEIGVGDFREWQNINEATDARIALADLRQMARQRVAPVTVDIQVKGGTPVELRFGEQAAAARQAVRLSGTEFVLFDEDFHVHIDFRWTLEPIHDGAVVLSSEILGSEIEPQLFHLSFRDPEDLTARIVSIIQSRMHRIRYIWPFSGSTPMVIRDSAFSLAPGTAVPVQRITWIDPERNSFTAGSLFTSRIRSASFYRYELSPDDFARAPGAGAMPDPMSNADFRVILVRPAEERVVFRVLTVALVALFVLAAAGAAWDLKKARRSYPLDASFP